MLRTPTALIGHCRGAVSREDPYRLDRFSSTRSRGCSNLLSYTTVTTAIGLDGGAEERTRTSTPLRAQAPEACASANSATSALKRREVLAGTSIYNVRSAHRQHFKSFTESHGKSSPFLRPSETTNDPAIGTSYRDQGIRASGGRAIAMALLSREFLAHGVISPLSLVIQWTTLTTP